MATSSISSCLCLRPLPTATLLAITGLLLISMATAGPVSRRSGDSTADKEKVTLRQVMNGVHMILTYMVVGPYAPSVEPQFTLAENVTCMVYDYYTHYSVLEAQLCSSHPNYSKIAATKFVMEKAVKDACNLMKYDSPTSGIKCFMKNIGDLCLIHKLYEADMYNTKLNNYADTFDDDLLFSATGKEEEWLTANTRPEYGEPEEPIFTALDKLTQFV